MPGRASYPQDYVDSCRARTESQVAIFRELAATARHGDPDGDPGLESVVQSLEPVYFNALLVALDAAFGDRDRAVEGSDGNPLHEVRVLRTSILENDDEVAADGAEAAPAADPDRTVLGLRPATRSRCPSTTSCGSPTPSSPPSSAATPGR